MVRIVEDDGMTESRRPRKFNVKKNKVALSPKSGNTFKNNRNLIQPHEPYENNVNSYSDETKELISVMKQTKKWTMNSKNETHPFLNYMKNNDHKDRGWLRQILPNNNNDNVFKKELDKEERMIFVTTYNLFLGFTKTHGPL